MNKSTLMTAGLMCILSSPLMAQDAQVGSEVDAAAAKTPATVPDGFHNKLSVGASFAFSTSQKVVGALDGNTMQLNINIDGGSTFKKGPLSIINEGKWVLGTTQTPAYPGLFIKGADTLNLQSTAFYALKKPTWVGPFGRASLATSVLPGVDIRDQGVEYTLAADGTPVDVSVTDVPGADGAKGYSKSTINGILEPLVLKEVVGAMATPIDKGTKLRVGLSLGVGAEEAISQGGYVVAEVTDSTHIKLNQIPSYVTAGAELEAKVAGSPNELVSYGAQVTMFQPIKTTATTDLTGLSLMNVDVTGKVSVKLAKWASLDWNLSAKKQPLILDDWQIQTGVLLTTTFNLL